MTREEAAGEARRRWTPFNVFLVVFLGAWLGGWAVGEVAAIRELLGEDTVEGGDAVFVAFWLVAWTAGGAAALYAWLWNLIGRETVEVGGGSLRLQKMIGPFKRDREFETDHVKDLRVSEGEPVVDLGWLGVPGDRLRYRGLSTTAAGPTASGIASTRPRASRSSGSSSRTSPAAPGAVSRSVREHDPAA